MKRILGTAAAVTIGILAANTVTVAAEELEQPGQDAAVTPLDSAGEISPEMTLQDDDGVSGNPGEGSMPAGSGFSDTETDSTTDKEDGKSDEIRPDSSLEGTGVQNQPDDEAKETEDLQHQCRLVREGMCSTLELEQKMERPLLTSSLQSSSLQSQDTLHSPEGI